MKKPTIKQKKAIILALENGGNITKAMRDAGYAEATVNNPSNLTDSDPWKEMLDKNLPDDLLQQKIKEGLEATKPIGAAILVTKDGKIVKAENEGAITIDDMPTRHKYIDTALKLKDKYPAEKHKVQGDADNPMKLEIEIIEEKHHE